MWDLPRSGIKPVSPALAGGFFIHQESPLPFFFLATIQFTQLCPTLCNPMDCSMSGFPVHHHAYFPVHHHVLHQSPSLLKLMSIALVMPFNHFILCRSLLFPPSIFPSIRVFSNELVLPIRWPKYWSFSFSISPSKNITPRGIQESVS